jgi:hypothetical protein
MITFDCRRLDEAARCYLPREATDIEVDRLSPRRFELRCRFPMTFDNSLPRAAAWARAIADHFERNGVCVAFDVNPAFGFHCVFDLV